MPCSTWTASCSLNYTTTWGGGVVGSKHQGPLVTSLFASTHPGVKEPAVALPGVRLVLPGRLTVSFQSTPGRVGSTGYHANQTRVNSLEVCTQGSQRPNLKCFEAHSETLVPDAVQLVVTARCGHRRVGVTTHGGVRQQVSWGSASLLGSASLVKGGPGGDQPV